MDALTLDFRRRPPPGWLGVLLLLAGVAGVVLVGAQYRWLIDEEARSESGMRSLAVVERRMAARSDRPEDARALALEVARARKLLDRMSVPWNEMFAGIEAVGSRNVGLLRIDSDMDGRRLKIEAEARNLGAMLKYLRAMEVQSEFADVYLHSHQVQQQDPQHPVRFTLTATWRTPPAGPSGGGR
jgi:Tfp pilus assembly protein PilN